MGGNSEHVLSRAIRITLLVAMLLGLLVQPATTSVALADGGTNWWEPAIEDTRDQFDALKTSVGQTVDTLEDARQKLDGLETWARNNLQSQELQGMLDKLGKARDALDTHSQPLKIFNDRLGQVGSVVDAAFELKGLAEAAEQRRGGDLAASLHILSKAMEKYGEKVPILGEAIKVYGQATLGILDATDQIAKTIDANRNQGMFGLGTYGGIDNPLYQALEQQLGADFASEYTFEPGRYPYLYESTENKNFTLIWDPSSETWFKVDRPPSVVQQLYHGYVLAKGHPTPSVLNILATTSFDAVQKRIAAGQDALDLWQGWAKGYGNIPFDAVNTQSDYELRFLLQDPQRFLARYTHDQDFHRQVDDWMVQIYREALKAQASGLDTETAAAIQAWAKKHGIVLPEPPDQGETPDTSNQPTSGAQPGPGTGAASSVLILIDASGSMAYDGKIDAAKAAAKNVLAQVGGNTEVALIAFYDCGDIRVEQDFTTHVGLVLTKVDQIFPAGSTPLAASIQFAKEYIRDNASSSKARLVILSDGEETCGGDPVSAARP